MIKTENGVTEIKGGFSEILADITITIKATRESLVERGISEDEAEKLINICIEDSKKSVQVLKDEAVELLMGKILSDLFGGSEDEN